MRMMILCMLGAAVFAAPCVYDATSREPSPMVGILAAAGASYPGYEQAKYAVPW
jgi:hypothetical protein